MADIRVRVDVDGRMYSECGAAFGEETYPGQPTYEDVRFWLGELARLAEKYEQKLEDDRREDLSEWLDAIEGA